MNNPRFLPPQIAAMALAAGLAAGFLFPGPRLPFIPYGICGAGLLTTGLTVMLRARSLFQKRGTPVKPTETPAVLVPDGPFRFSRNPMYLGLTLALAGAALLSGWRAALIAPVIFWTVMNFRQIPFEEERMSALFGTSYQEYKKRVRRWL